MQQAIKPRKADLAKKPAVMLQATIPFDEIVIGATARLVVIEDVQYLSVRDVLMHICDLSTIRANEKWRLLSDEVKNELAEFLGNFQFPGKGNRTEPVITFQGVLKLIMLVSGQKAALYRSAMVKILQKYYAGDSSLLQEVEANAQSAGPIQQMARASLVAEAVPVEDETLSLPFKKRRMELEMAKMEADVDAQRLANEGTKHSNRAAELANSTTECEHVKDVTSSYKGLCEDTVMDERARLILKDKFLNMALLQGCGGAAGGGPGLITNGKPISLSLVAHELGMKIASNDLISIGQEVKRRFVDKHGKAPPKHEQLCGGRATLVNTYMDGDRALLEDVLKWHVAGRP